MSNHLVSYVEKYILNPAASIRPTIEDEGNEETRANFSKKIEGEEGAQGAAVTHLSKLRLSNAELLGDKDPRYRGQKTARKEIKGTTTCSYDPDLAKYCLLEDEDNDSMNTGGDESSAEEDADSGVSATSFEGDSLEKRPKLKKKNADELESDVDASFWTADDDEDEHDDDEEHHDDDDVQTESEVEDESDQGENEMEEDDASSDQQNSFKTFSTQDSSDQLSKAVAVKSQCATYDALFEARIGLQKVSTSASQLPQHDTYRAFLSAANYPQYKTNLLAARKAVKKLMAQVLELQDSMLSSNSETSHILSSEVEGKGEDSEEEEGEAKMSEEEGEGKKTREGGGTKRKKTRELERALAKRHRAARPFAHRTLDQWHEKCKLVSTTQRRGGNFGAFELAPTQLMKNQLAKKEDLVRRTQVVGVARGNVHIVLGKAQQGGALLEETHDCEIFDDTDLYSRLLEDVLKSKIGATTAGADVADMSRRWADVRRLRNKAAAARVDKASKGKKIRFQVMSKLQHFLAPCKPSPLDDDATNRLFSSLFGQH